MCTIFVFLLNICSGRQLTAKCVLSTLGEGTAFMAAEELYVINSDKQTMLYFQNDYCTRWCKREHIESNALNK